MSIRDFADWQFPRDAYDEENDFSWESHYMLYLQVVCLVYSVASMKVSSIKRDMCFIAANVLWCVFDYCHIMAHHSGDRSWYLWIHYTFVSGIIFLAQSFQPQTFKGFIRVAGSILISDYLLIRIGGEAAGTLSAIFTVWYPVWNIIWLRNLFILTQCAAFLTLLWNDVLGRGGHFWTEFAVCCTFTVCNIGLLVAKQGRFGVVLDKRESTEMETKEEAPRVSGHLKST